MDIDQTGEIDINEFLESFRIAEGSAASSKLGSTPRPPHGSAAGRQGSLSDADVTVQV